MTADQTQEGTGRRSARWFEVEGLAGFMHRAAMRATGLSGDALLGRPVIGICNCWSDLVSCNLHFRALANAVRRGILLEGGVPVEFPVITLGENLMKPTAMLFRNLMAMDVEESIRSYPLDAVVLLGGCDKTIPAQLMGAASADVPAIIVTGGPSAPAVFDGRALGNGTDLWRFSDDVRAGRMSQEAFEELEAGATPSLGHCTEMGTASTMAALSEALGMALPGTATIPATHAARARAAEETGRRAVRLVADNLRPSDILTSEAFENAVTLLTALGGSTNAVIHLIALAGRVGVPLDLATFDAIGRRTPVLANVRPVGEHLVEDLHRAGGVPALINELLPLLHREALTVTGQPIARCARSARNRDVVAPLDAPIRPDGGLAVLYGSLAPRGGIIKHGAASRHLLRHRGPALVWDGLPQLLASIDDPDLEVDESTVLILRNVGPRGGHGMPEWGQLPIPGKLLTAGVKDMLRISDARMSGTAFGTVVVHVAPEAAIGGPLALVRTGDPVAIDIEHRSLELEVDERALAARAAQAEQVARRFSRGYRALHEQHVLQADEGCDLDFLRFTRASEADLDAAPAATGWLGGW